MENGKREAENGRRKTEDGKRKIENSIYEHMIENKKRKERSTVYNSFNPLLNHEFDVVLLKKYFTSCNNKDQSICYIETETKNISVSYESICNEHLTFYKI